MQSKQQFFTGFDKNFIWYCNCIQLENVLFNYSRLLLPCLLFNYIYPLTITGSARILTAKFLSIHPFCGLHNYRGGIYTSCTIFCLSLLVQFKMVYLCMFRRDTLELSLKTMVGEILSTRERWLGMLYIDVSPRSRTGDMNIEIKIITSFPPH